MLVVKYSLGCGFLHNSRRRPGWTSLQPATQDILFCNALRKIHSRKVEVTAAVSDRPSSSGREGSGPDADRRPRLAKVLAASGIASRRACEALIDAGRVRVNGRVISEQGVTIDPLRDRVDILQPPPDQEDQTKQGPTAAAGQQQQQQSKGAGAKQQQGQQPGDRKQEGGKGAAAGGSWKKVVVSSYLEADSLFYFVVNKPKGYICSSSDVNGKGKLAVELLEPWLEGWRRKNKDPKRLPPRFFTVGRLDVASTGLIFMTNDGEWANKVIHPSSGVTKEYAVGLAGDANRQQLAALAAGTKVAGAFVTPLEVEVLGDPRRLRIVVQEGKKHEVRELVKAAGLELVTLRRVRIGGFRLPRDLGLGGYRELKPSELRKITDPGAQAAASASGATRQKLQQQEEQRRQAAARAAVPGALRGLPEEVLEKFRQARER